MPFDQWQRAAQHFLNLIKRFWPEYFEAWDKYYLGFYFGGCISSECWPAARAYDKILRDECRPSKGLLPAFDVQTFWDKAEEITLILAKKLLREEIQTEMKAMMAANVPSKASQAAAAPVQGGKEQCNSVAAVASSSSNVTSAPPLFQGRQAATQTPHQFCYRCGSRSHWNGGCTATQQVNGKELQVAVNTRGAVVLRDLSRFCYNFNKADGCPPSDPPCTNGAHVCSLCLSKSHGAITCMAT
jgi:hypothetical protein